jgi:hypothetical protein
LTPQACRGGRTCRPDPLGVVHHCGDLLADALRRPGLGQDRFDPGQPGPSVLQLLMHARGPRRPCTYLPAGGVEPVEIGGPHGNHFPAVDHHGACVDPSAHAAPSRVTDIGRPVNHRPASPYPVRRMPSPDSPERPVRWRVVLVRPVRQAGCRKREPGVRPGLPRSGEWERKPSMKHWMPRKRLGSDGR